MATIKVVDVLGRASVLLQDTDQTRFSNANLLKFFNDAQREVALQRPDAFMTNGNFTCSILVLFYDYGSIKPMFFFTVSILLLLYDYGSIKPIVFSLCRF